MVGELEAPDAVGARVCESSFHVAEELALKGSLSQRAGIYGDQGTGRAGRERVQRLGYDFFARSMLAGDKHVGIGGPMRPNSSSTGCMEDALAMSSGRPSARSRRFSASRISAC